MIKRIWKNTVPGPIIGYVYNYDGANRLTDAEFGYYNNSTGWNSNSMYKLPVISYDGNGNILTMQRNGVNGTAMDNFGYTYQTNKNRLASISNTVSGNQTYNYSYDSNGNVVGDQFRGISNIVYNNRNLPEQLVNSQGTTVNYWYDGNGNRIRKQQNGSDELYVLGAGGETEAVFNTDGTAKFFNIIAGKEAIGRYEPVIDSLKLSNLSLNRTYSAKHIVAGTQVVVPTDAELKAGTDIRLKPGFTTLDGSTFNALIDNTVLTPQRYYYVKDHLGSIRVTVDQAGEIISYDDYDPWGMQLDGRSDNLASQQ